MSNFFAPFPDLSQFAKLSDIPAGVEFVHPRNQPVTLVQLYSTYPAGVGYKGKYAQVTDCWGPAGNGIFGVMRCGYNGRIYYWEATTQPNLPGTMVLSADQTFQPLLTPPVMQVSGSVALGVNRKLTIGLDNAFPGLTKTIQHNWTSLLGSVSILGLGIGAGIAGALGGSTKLVCLDTGSALEWRQLI